MSEKEILEKISQKLNILIALSLNENKELKKLKDKVEFLTNFGISHGVIAEILGTTKHTVEVTVSRLRKNK